MQPTALLVFLGLVASAVANPVANPDADVLQSKSSDYYIPFVVQNIIRD
jgi:hypothetical protein